MEKTDFNGATFPTEKFLIALKDGSSKPIRDASDLELQDVYAKATRELADANSVFLQLVMHARIAAIASYEIERRKKAIAIASSLPM